MTKFICIAFVFLIPFTTFSAEPTENLSGVMGALAGLIEKETPIPGQSNPGPSLTPNAEAISKDLQGDLDNCQSSKSEEPELIKVEKNGLSLDFKKFDIRIHGPNCPIELLARTQVLEQSKEKLDAEFHVMMTFKHPSFIEKYKLKSLSLNGNIRAHAQQIGNTVQIPLHVSISGNGESTELGVFSQNTSVDGLVELDPSKFLFSLLMEQRAAMQYQDVNKKAYSKMKISGFSQPEILHTINDQPVSESEFQAFMETFIMPAMIEEEEDQSQIPGGKAPTSCRFVAYDKKKMTVSSLKTQMSSSNLPQDGLVSSGQSCSKDKNSSFQHQGQTFADSIQFGQEWISYSTTTAANKTKRVYVLYGDSVAQVTETDELLLGLQCQRVSQCP